MTLLKDSIEQFERGEIFNALKDSDWVMARAARKLGITERMIRYKIKKYGIERGQETQESNREINVLRTTEKQAEPVKHYQGGINKKMSKFAKAILTFASVCLLSTSVLYAEDQPAAPAATAATAAAPAPPVTGETKAAGVTLADIKNWLGLSIYLQGGYTYNFANPDSQENGLRVFDHKANSFTLDLAEILFNKDAAVGGVGYRLKLSAGETAKFIHAAGLGNTNDEFDLTEAYIDYVAPLGQGLWEIRMRGKGGIARALFEIRPGRQLIVGGVFAKKTQKVPAREIRLAVRRLKEADDG